MKTGERHSLQVSPDMIRCPACRVVLVNGQPDLDFRPILAVNLSDKISAYCQKCCGLFELEVVVVAIRRVG